MRSSVPLRLRAEVTLGRMRDPTSEKGPLQVPYLRAANIGDGFMRLADTKSMHFDPREQRRYRLELGDVLVTEASGSRDQVGQSASVEQPAVGKMFQNTLIRLRPVGETNDRFLYWWSRHAFASGAYARASQGLGIWHLGAERLRALPFPVVPLEEQRRVAGFLDDQVKLLDRAIELRHLQTSLTTEVQEAFLLESLSGGHLGEPVEAGRLPWLPVTPGSWPVAKIVHHARLGSGHTPSRTHPEWWVDCNIPWITTGEVAQLRDDRLEVLTETRERISALGVANSSAEVHPQGTVVLSRTASAGFSAVMGANMATSQDYVTWTCEPTLDPFFLLWCLRAMRRDLLGRLAMGSTHKTIYVPDIQGIKVPVPPRAVQEAVVDRIRGQRMAFSATEDLMGRQVELLKERKRAVITAAVTGDFDVSTASVRRVA